MSTHHIPDPSEARLYSRSRPCLLRRDYGRVRAETGGYKGTPSIRDRRVERDGGDEQREDKPGNIESKSVIIEELSLLSSQTPL